MVDRIVQHSLVKYLGDDVPHKRERETFNAFGGCTVARVEDVAAVLFEQIPGRASHLLLLSGFNN